MLLLHYRCVHGTCLPINAFSYSCKCLEGHGGVLCDEEEDLFNPCQMIKCKHGKCRLSGLGQPYCECSSGYTGDSCDRGKLGRYLVTNHEGCLIPGERDKSAVRKLLAWVWLVATVVDWFSGGMQLLTTKSSQVSL